jgi:hypothetical protein
LLNETRGGEWQMPFNDFAGRYFNICFVLAVKQPENAAADDRGSTSEWRCRKTMKWLASFRTPLTPSH